MRIRCHPFRLMSAPPLLTKPCQRWPLRRAASHTHKHPPISISLISLFHRRQEGGEGRRAVAIHSRTHLEPDRRDIDVNSAPGAALGHYLWAHVGPLSSRHNQAPPDNLSSPSTSQAPPPLLPSLFTVLASQTLLSAISRFRCVPSSWSSARNHVVLYTSAKRRPRVHLRTRAMIGEINDDTCK